MLEQEQGAQHNHNVSPVDSARSLTWQATAILRQPDPQKKAEQTHTVTKLWKQQQLVTGSTDSGPLPDRPGRDDSNVWHSVYSFETLAANSVWCTVLHGTAASTNLA